MEGSKKGGDHFRVMEMCGRRRSSYLCYQIRARFLGCQLHQHTINAPLYRLGLEGALQTHTRAPDAHAFNTRASMSDALSPPHPRARANPPLANAPFVGVPSAHAADAASDIVTTPADRPGPCTATTVTAVTHELSDARHPALSRPRGCADTTTQTLRPAPPCSRPSGTDSVRQLHRGRGGGCGWR